MGYYTSFRIQPLPPRNDEKLKRLHHTLESVSDYEFDVMEDELYANAKWYDHEEHLKEVSRREPDITIRVEGKGEEQGDHWVKFFRDGQMEEHTQPEWHPPEKPRGFE